ncbi:transposase domain-containing protein [Streptomyces sp. NPDC088090]|uniref:transposase domain-containing protein n=1 Tax=Streptomyces sp. NPDC088090 TaxID=3365822 RepID=UPI0038500FC5
MRFGILTKVFTAELVDAAIAKHDRAERRHRLLPAKLVVCFVLVPCLFARESYEEVLRVPTSGIPGSRALARVNRSSFSRARARIGEDVLETVFRQVAGPLATPATPDAWWRGLRLLALDGTQFGLPDSTSNGDTFDGPSTTGGVPFAFPQVKAVVLTEIGVHEVLDARLGDYRDGERSLAYPLAGSTGPGDLAIADRGSWSAEFAHVFTTVGADPLVMLQSTHLGPAGPIRSRPPEGVRQELWACLAVHHAIRQFAHATALARPVANPDRVPYPKCVRIVRRSVPSRLGATATKLTRSFAEAERRHVHASCRPGAAGTAHARSGNRTAGPC